MKPMLNWSQIDTLLLDMDGTLLDLHYDNQFWNHRVPEHYAEYHQVSIDEARQLVHNHFKQVAGTLNWYCLDYWQTTLQLPIRELKARTVDLIRLRDDVPPFLQEARRAGKQILLLTNAHPDALALKNQHTNLEQLCDQQFSTHSFGACKEDQKLWQRLHAAVGFNPGRTLFIDDGEAILDSAQTFGIAHLLGVENPDSQLPAKVFQRHRSFDNYARLQPIIST
ncbi:HAD family hydrolase [Aliidiomarina sedimenti]|uniref:HAD family hydrolase n=2 Tax=Aliidiomarina sedimenti TaxID=1933879 RepID=A0ABY0C025_9GAMM|nr:HAD family hydrolase [Aliidiomarina sedimenti]